MMIKREVFFMIYSHAEHINPATSVRPSILQVMERVMHQVDYNCFASPRLKWIDPFYKELCLVIAEVLVLDPDTIISINGSKVSALLVQEVYGQLTNGHLRLVFDNFKNITNRVLNKKAYLRTALYNVFFEIESHYLNDMHCD
jgi:hypothetical protein